MPLIPRTLVVGGQLAKDAVSATTIARLYREAGLPRGHRADGHARLRWQAAHAGALWHGDVCHGPALRTAGTTRPLRIHALLDDSSRLVVALEAHHSERDDDMLGIFLAALRRHGAPDALYLDNGAARRLGVTLIHAHPGDAPARGKMGRFWRTLRQGCLDHLGMMTQLHDVQARLLAFLDHRAPHCSASCPATHRRARPRADRRAHLTVALTTRIRRRVRRDGTLDVDGTPWQLDQSFRAGVVVTIAVDKTDTVPPVVEHDGQRYVRRAVDVVAAGKTRCKLRTPPRTSTVPFDPARAFLGRFASRPARHSPEEA